MTDEEKSPHEPERYELLSGPAYRFALPRRDFFRAVGGGILVCLALEEGRPATQESGGGRRRGGGESVPEDLAAWIHIGEKGEVSVFTGKAEVGQNIRTSLTQVVAEELRAPLASVRLVMADTDVTPYDMGTFGSRTIPIMAPQLRKAAASARELLVDLAAEHWETDRGSLVADSGKVLNRRTGETVSYGALTRGQKILKTVSDAASTQTASEWKVSGQSVRKVDGRAMVTGRHRFTSDLKRPGMLCGRILRAPLTGAKPVAVEKEEAEAVPGAVVVHDADFIGVAAPDEESATRALSLVRVKWSAGDGSWTGNLYDYFKRNASPEQSRGGQSRGSIENGLSAADRKLQQSYTVAYIAHVPLEPRAALAEWSAEKLTVWTGTQRPFGVRSELAEAFRIPVEKVRVIVPDTGSGYGGKHTGEAAVEAARLSKAAGKPVKVVWTREEEFTWAYVRPAGLIEVRSGVQNDGSITAWEFHNYNSGTSAISPLYHFPNVRVEFHPVRSPLRQGSYRGLAATANHFARETHIDEIARSVGIDPVQLRLKNLTDPRLRAVLETAAERFGWGRAKTSARVGFGIACGFEKGSYIASCAEVLADQPAGEFRLVRIVSAYECGAIVNPAHLRIQVEGAIVQGLGGALFEAVEFDRGKILNARLSRYRVPRFSDTPELVTVLLDRKDLPSAGAGETPIVCVAPAIGNAIFDATGLRLRSLPLLPNGLKTG